MGYFLIAALAVPVVRWWRSPRSDEWYMARFAALLAAVIAVQMWWQT